MSNSSVMALPATAQVALEVMETWGCHSCSSQRSHLQGPGYRSGTPRRILEAGWRSPSASNRQKWDFVLVTEPGQLQELSTVWTGARHLRRQRQRLSLFSLSLSLSGTGRSMSTTWARQRMAMMLAAADLGIGSGHAAIGDQ